MGTGAGIPDIENIMAISALFDISIDDLLQMKEVQKGSGERSTCMRVLRSMILMNRSIMI